MIGRQQPRHTLEERTVSPALAPLGRAGTASASSFRQGRFVVTWPRQCWSESLAFPEEKCTGAGAPLP
jgi:hypothetical protein